MSSIEITDDREILVEDSMSFIIRSSTVNINYRLSDGEYKIMFLSDSNNACVINERGTVDNAKVKIAYLQLEQEPLIQKNRIDVGAGSSLEINTVYLGADNKDIVFDLYNNGSDSLIDISNNVVCLDEADFQMEVIGTIRKGAKRSKCHQSTHCLTIGEPKKALVKPVLNIDENDVEASHALSSGTIDEEILFYMNSRGLQRKEALNLILRSYLMPSDSFYEGFIDGELIREEAIRKVDHLCSM